MTLPDPASQWLFSRIAWALVLAAVVIGLASRRPGFPRRGMACLAIVAAAAQALPGPWAPAYWLGLAFQSPSALTVALCALMLRRHWVGGPPANVLPLPFAAVLAVAGACLYLDASGWTALGLYYLGFGVFGAPLAALLLASLCVFAIVRGAAVETAAATFAALTLFMLARMPTGNLWDALIDPFLWGWAVLVCAKAARAARRTRILHQKTAL